MANEPNDKQGNADLDNESAEQAAEEASADAANKEHQTEQDSEQDSADSADAEPGDEEQQDPVSELEEKLADAKDQLLRAAAEMQNVRRRAENDVEKAHKFGMEKLCTELLPVVDNLERAQQQAGDIDDAALKPVLEGIELTHKSFLDVLAKFNLEPVDPAGEPFDPQLHQAMTMVENPDCEPNTVMDVMQKGFTLHGRLLRPAMVVVSK